MIIIPGIIAFDLFGDEIRANCDTGNCGDSAYPLLIKKLLPIGYIGIMLAALFGAILSTLDSLLNSAATIFTVDIYKPFINKKASSSKKSQSRKTLNNYFNFHCLSMGSCNNIF